MVSKTVTELIKNKENDASNNENVEILFERFEKPKSSERRADDKFKSTADVKRKPSKTNTADNIDMKLRNLMPKMLKTVGDIRYVINVTFF